MEISLPKSLSSKTIFFEASPNLPPRKDSISLSASSNVLGRCTPFPSAAPSALITGGILPLVLKYSSASLILALLFKTDAISSKTL